ncbi:hypothetical protein [Streptomyces camelliae]|uniref:Macromomycin n=1 Tax=Streptomyces camelliae TaxID=3004093 RepID=A0ABY7P6A8_9ACTN|nr:hypothetical protein [Streptomyces sp. HUAS 2-6]WBO66096.1 hypothetical protein O1G22_26450 [Streptomyces sp. HUAS 2-6]
MRCSRTRSRIFIGAALLALAGPVAVSPALAASPAFAASPVGTVSPAKVKAGQDVHLTLAGCSKPREGGRAEGALIETVDLTLKVTGTLVGTARIDPDAHTGETQIHLACVSDPDDVATVDVTITS